MLKLKHYHRIYAEISLDAIEHNVARVRERIPRETLLMAVIKADGYGHGAAPLARFLRGKCDCFAVAVLEEALTLRQAGMTEPLLILGYTSPSQFPALVRSGAAQTVFSLPAAQALSEAAQAAGQEVAVHVAVDTGMSRVGFLYNDPVAPAEAAAVARLPGLRVEGVFTHLARADEADKTFAMEQCARFDAFTAQIRAAGAEIPVRHICNSAGIMELDRQYDMVRLGISLYGLYPSAEVNERNLALRPAMSIKTHIIHLKTLPAGVGVSYGHTFVTNRLTRVATLPVGYADGYPRALSNCGRVIIRGQFAPIIGRICMDQCMVDVTDLPPLEIEEEVILLGVQGSCAVTMEEIGAASASFNYETACRVGQRVPRVYTYRGEVVDFQSALVTESTFGGTEIAGS